MTHKSNIPDDNQAIGCGANNVSASPSGGNGGSGIVIVRYLT
jgi:hypothetical protein